VPKAVVTRLARDNDRLLAELRACMATTASKVKAKRTR
jgi:hypothetical protein